MYKIFVKGNYFYIVDENNVQYEGHCWSVLVKRHLDSSSVFYFKNVNGFNEKKAVNFSDIRNESNNTYSSVAEFVEFYENNTGNKFGGSTGDYGSAYDSADYGWVHVTDSQYTEANPLSISSGVRTKITNNAAVLLNVTGLSNGSTIWNPVTNKLEPDNLGDTYLVRFKCTANPSVNNRNFSLDLDIGGDQNVIWDKTMRLARGSNVNTIITETLDIFTLNTFISNGGEFFVTCDGDVDVFNISFKIERTYKHLNS